MNTYVIGDVHGCYNTLLDLINKLPKDSRIIFVGDLCDRGLYSREVIEYVIDNNSECILGNHEDFMLKHIEDYFSNKSNRWYDNPEIGGKKTIDSYKDDKKTLLRHIEYLKKLPRYILSDNYFITHGLGLPYFKRRDSKDIYIQDGLIKARLSDETTKWGEGWEKDWKSYEIVNIFGHTHNDEIVVGGNYYCIDTGCVYGGKLTAIELGSMNVIEVPLNKKDVELSLNELEEETKVMADSYIL